MTWFHYVWSKYKSRKVSTSLVYKISDCILEYNWIVFVCYAAIAVDNFKILCTHRLIFFQVLLSPAAVGCFTGLNWRLRGHYVKIRDYRPLMSMFWPRPSIPNDRQAIKVKKQNVITFLTVTLPVMLISVKSLFYFPCFNPTSSFN